MDEQSGSERLSRFRVVLTSKTFLSAVWREGEHIETEAIALGLGDVLDAPGKPIPSQPLKALALPNRQWTALASVVAIGDRCAMSEPEWSLVDRMPTPQEHRRLSEAVGWADAFDWASLPTSLDASLAGVVAESGGDVIGMGRLVGDGVLYFYVQDVAVLPTHQGRGIGAALLDRLLQHVRRLAPAQAFVGLFATGEAVPLYQSRGFTAGDMHGMFHVVPPDADAGGSPPDR